MKCYLFSNIYFLNSIDDMEQSTPIKATPKNGRKSNYNSNKNANQTRSCPICHHGNYKNPRSVDQHIKMKHPNHANRSEMQALISEASKEPKQKCPHCHLLKSKLSRHLKTCTSRPELGSQEDASGTSQSSANHQFLQRFRARLNRPGSGFAKTTVKNYLNYIRKMIGKSFFPCDSTSISWVTVTCFG